MFQIVPALKEAMKKKLGEVILKGASHQTGWIFLIKKIHPLDGKSLMKSGATHFSVVGDLFQIVPALTEGLKKKLGK